jgi:glyoxylase-like metal-dependent hydrolase (beta-lactamase superfamily II)
MKLSNGIYLVGSGNAGFRISNRIDSHVYLLENPGSHILIDAGVGIEEGRIIFNIENEGFDPAEVGHILITHVHSDHAGGAAKLKKKLGAKVYISSAEAGLMRSPDLKGLGLDIAIPDGFYPQGYEFPPCEPDTELNGGETLTIGDWPIEVIHTPGHSLGSLCFHIERDGRNILFSGDVVVHGGKLMFLNCVGSVMKDYRENIGKLEGLGVEELYPGHGAVLIEGGQEHIDIAVENLRHLGLPPNAL